eukprot:CAMPEP_0170588794 /NCGR_PEP_ID=MMETSP0224-20130122/11020_1 /TAXON_ID=285029 /ORGANISM="Togula jolla, Strain CCCM 725" /LENGTH=75 /DNA_ID=CAMNT_0010912535 /DNA_START=517 /DNA_END=744 /DNA_ORIENTATION=-
MTEQVCVCCHCLRAWRASRALPSSPPSSASAMASSQHQVRLHFVLSAQVFSPPGEGNALWTTMRSPPSSELGPEF